MQFFSHSIFLNLGTSGLVKRCPLPTRPLLHTDYIKLFLLGSFQANSTVVWNRCSQIFFKFLTLDCFHERSISLKILASQCNSVLLYGSLKFQGFTGNFWFANFFHFQGLLLSDSFCCQSYWSYFLNLDQEQFQKHLEQKVEGHLIHNNSEFNFQKNAKSGGIDQFYNFFKFRCLAKHSRYLMFSNIEEPYDMLPKYSNSAITKLFYFLGAKNERNTKIAKISPFFIFKPT